MIRHWIYVEPIGPERCPEDPFKPIFIRKTDEEILEDYFSYWAGMMAKAGKEHLISTERCIDDYVTVNWAWIEGEE